jgi:hypothetical protein
MHIFTYEEKETFYACVSYASSRMMVFHADANDLKLVVHQELNEMDEFELSNPVYNFSLH